MVHLRFPFLLLLLSSLTFFPACNGECNKDDVFYDLEAVGLPYFPYAQIDLLRFQTPTLDTVNASFYFWEEGYKGANNTGPNDTKEPCPKRFFESHECIIDADSGRLYLRLVVAANTGGNETKIVMDQGTSKPILVNATLEANGNFSYGGPEFLDTFVMNGTTYTDVAHFMNTGISTPEYFNQVYFKPGLGFLRIQRLNGETYDLIP